MIDPEFAFYGTDGLRHRRRDRQSPHGLFAPGRPRGSPGRAAMPIAAWMLETIENSLERFPRKFVELWRDASRHGDAYPAVAVRGPDGAASARGRAAGLYGAAVRPTPWASPRRRSSAASSASRTISISTDRGRGYPRRVRNTGAAARPRSHGQHRGVSRYRRRHRRGAAAAGRLNPMLSSSRGCRGGRTASRPTGRRRRHCR